VEEVIEKTQLEIAGKLHVTALSSQNKATGNEWYESSHVVLSEIPRQYVSYDIKPQDY
jgi:hypothetical protein